MIKCTFFITRSDGSHNMKQFKNIFKDLKMDEDNYIEMSLKKFTMNLQFKFYCKSLDFYLDILKRLLMNSSLDDVRVIMETILRLIDYGSSIEWSKDKIKISYKDGTVTLILDENKREKEWVFYALDVYAHKIVYNKSIEGVNGCTLNIEAKHESIPSKLSIFYNYEDHKICMNGDVKDISKENAVLLFTLYNSGCLESGQSITLKDSCNNSEINYTVCSRN